MPASDAEGACEKVNKQDLDGRTIRVNEAQPKGMSAPRGAPPVAEEAEVDLEVHEAMIEEEAVVVDMDTKVNWMDTVLYNGCDPPLGAGCQVKVSQQVPFFAAPEVAAVLEWQDILRPALETYATPHNKALAQLARAQ